MRIRSRRFQPRRKAPTSEGGRYKGEEIVGWAPEGGATNAGAIISARRRGEAPYLGEGEALVEMDRGAVFGGDGEC